MNERNINSETTRAIVAQDRNALAPRGGVFFDGTSGAKIMSTLTGQVIGTDSFSFSVMFRVPTVAPVSADYGGIMLLASSATSPNAVYYVARLHLDSDGKLYFTLNEPGGTGFIAKVRTLSSVVATLGGKFVHVVVVRNAAGNAGTIYINGVASSESVAGYTGSWQTIAVTSTYLHFGYDGTGGYNTANLLLTCASLYNLALDAASVLEIYELGGAVPERFKFGTQQNIITASFGNSGGAGGYETFSSASAAGFTAVNSSSGGNAASTIVPAVGIGAQYRVRGSITLNSGSLPSALLYEPSWSTQIANAPVLTAGSFDLTLTATASSPTGSRLAIFTAINSDFVLSGVTLQRLGAVAHYDADLDGIGYQLHDQSTNKLDAVLTATGVSWTKPARRGYVRGTLTWAGTHEAKSLIGQRAFPVGALVNDVVLTPTASSSGAGPAVGCTNSANRWVGTAAMTANVREARALNQRIPAAAGDSNHDILIDPDTANFTGSIAAEVQYSVTEGTP